MMTNKDINKKLARYEWLMHHAVNNFYKDSEGEEHNENPPWLHFDNVNKGETIEEALDRHILNKSTNAVL